MLKFLILVISCILVAGVVSATDGVEAPKKCVNCGMDRGVFARSRAVVRYADGSAAGTCSIHCAVEEMKKSAPKPVAELKVADYSSTELIDAKSAVWVVGGKKKGVMTSPAKWAFAREAEAQKFLQENGGKITPYQQVVQAVQQEVEEMAQHPKMD